MVGRKEIALAIDYESFQLIMAHARERGWAEAPLGFGSAGRRVATDEEFFADNQEEEHPLPGVCGESCPEYAEFVYSGCDKRYSDEFMFELGDSELPSNRFYGRQES